MSPLPGWAVIPTGWAAHHRPTVDNTLRTPCTIRRIAAGPPPYPKPAGWVGEQLLHTTTCRVQELKRESSSTPGEQPTQVRGYMIVLPVAGTPELRSGERGDIVVALGRRYRIEQVLHGTHEFEIDLICSDNLTQQNS